MKTNKSIILNPKCYISSVKVLCTSQIRIDPFNFEVPLNLIYILFWQCLKYQNNFHHTHFCTVYWTVSVDKCENFVLSKMFLDPCCEVPMRSA